MLSFCAAAGGEPEERERNPSRRLTVDIDGVLQFVESFLEDSKSEEETGENSLVGNGTPFPTSTLEVLLFTQGTGHGCSWWFDSGQQWCEWKILEWIRLARVDIQGQELTDRREVRVAAFKPLKWGSLRERWEVEREETVVVVVEEEAEIGDKAASRH